MKYSIIIPTRNEELGIAKVICSIPEEIKKDAEIIVVDSSEDLTPKIAECLGAKVLRPKKKGKGYAMRYAAKRAKGEILIFLDGDGTDPAEYIPKLVKKLERADMVLGTRAAEYTKKDDPKMQLRFRIYKLFIIPAFKAIGWPLKGDPLAGFRALRKETWEKMNLKSDGFLIETEMDIKAIEMGLKLAEVPIPHLKRAGGVFSSKMTFNIKEWSEIAKYIIAHMKGKQKEKWSEKFNKFLKENE